MPMTSESLYGLQVTGDLAAGIVHIRSDEIRNWRIVGPVLTQAVVTLPDATKCRQKGWPLFVIYNIAQTSIQIEDYSANVVGEIFSDFDYGGVGIIGLADSSTPSGVWVLQSKAAYVGIPELGPPFVTCFGSDNVNKNEVHTYDFNTESWTVRTNMPAVGYGGFFASSGAWFDSSALQFRSIWRNALTTYEFSLGSHVAKLSGSTNMAHSATAEVRSGTFQGVLFVSPKSGGSNVFQVFTPLTNTHGNARTGNQYWENGVTALFQDDGNPLRVGLLGTDPTGNQNFRVWSPVPNTVATMPKPANYLYKATMVAAGGDLYVLGGNGLVGSPAIFASPYNRKYDSAFRVWVQRPNMPMSAQGLGACEMIGDQFFFGMGAPVDYDTGGVTGNWTYSEAALSYATLGFFAWGKRDMREVSWSSQTRF